MLYMCLHTVPKLQCLNKFVLILVYLGSQHDAARRYRSISATRAQTAANQLHVAAANWLSIDGTDKQPDGRTHGHRTVTQTLSARSG